MPQQLCIRTASIDSTRLGLLALCLAVIVSSSGCDTPRPVAPTSIQIIAPGSGPAEVAKRHTELAKGELPILLVATHDGHIEPLSIPSRENVRQLQRFSTARDRFTAPLAHEIAEELERLTGARPYIVVNRLSRRVMDPNRGAEVAYEHPHGAAAYEAFHRVLADAVRQVQTISPRALLIDLHGQTKHPADVCIGTQDGLALRPLRKHVKDNTAWLAVELGREFVTAGFAVPGLVHQFETDWVGKHRESTARLVTVPAELPLGMRNGGWLVRHYSLPPNGIASLQLEVHRRIRYQPEMRRRFAKTLARMLERFMQQSVRPESP